MWHIKNPDIRKSTLDFTSSEQGHFEVSQLVYENCVLMNAIELMEFDENAVQLIICDHCGTVQCNSGNWVSFRKSGNFILLIPSFERIEEDSWSADEFSPPTYYDKDNHNKVKGTPYFDIETYENIRSSFLKFPSLQDIKHLKMNEAVRIAQFNMPYKFFGEPPEIFIQPNKIRLAVASSEGNLEEVLRKIEKILKINHINNSNALVRKPLPNEEIVSVFIDVDEFTDWQVLVKNDENYLLLLEEELVIQEIP